MARWMALRLVRGQVRVHDAPSQPLTLQVFAGPALDYAESLYTEIIRWGGEEFLVCLPQTPLADALTVAEKLRKSVESVTDPESLTVSIGACEIAPLQHLAQAVARADQALFQAKSGGRNQVCVLP